MKTNYARLRLVTVDGVLISTGYKSGRSSSRGTPDLADSGTTRSAGTRLFNHFWTAWYRTPKASAVARTPPNSSIARCTAVMGDNLQLPVANSQQLPVIIFSNSMQPMVVNAEKERKRFVDALNARVERDHPDTRGRPQWLHGKLKQYRDRTDRRSKVVSVATCAYWLNGKKIAGLANASMLCGALDMTRDELFGATEDPLLSELVDRWKDIPDNVKNAISALILQKPAAIQKPAKPVRAAAR